MNNRPAPLLQVNDLKMHFAGPRPRPLQPRLPVRSVDGVSFQIKHGETLGLVGESGCGKTTTARAIMRLLEPTDGSIIFNGTDITHMGQRQLRPLRHDFQMIAQDPFSSLNPRMRVGRLLREPMQIANIPRAEQLERLQHSLRRVGLNESHITRFPHEFSGGQRQRLAIARALMLNPKLVICDEPVSALDVSVQAQIVNLLQDLQHEFGLTYLFVSHDLSIVRHISTNVAVMYLGKIMEYGTRHDVFSRPRHPYTSALISAVPKVGGKRGQRVVLHGELPSPINPPSGCRFHTRCPYAQPICRTDEPALSPKEAGQQLVACHFPLD